MATLKQKRKKKRNRRRYRLHHLVKPYYKLEVKTRTVYLGAYEMDYLEKGKSLTAWKHIEELRKDYGYNIQTRLI